MEEVHGPAVSVIMMVLFTFQHFHRQQERLISFQQRISKRDYGKHPHSAQVITTIHYFLMTTVAFI